MPMQLFDVNISDNWSEDVKPSIIDDLEFYCGSPVTTETRIQTASLSIPITTGMGATSTTGIQGSDPWKTFEMDEDLFMSMSPPNPLGFDEISSFVDWVDNPVEIVDPVVTSSENIDSDVLFKDCMWAGPCGSNEQETRTLPKQAVNSNCDSVTNNNNNNNITCNSNKTNNTTTTTTNNVTSVDKPVRILPQTQNCTNNTNSSSNNNNTTISLPSSCNNASNSNNSNTSVVQTIEVPSVSGPVRRTEVIVQKTVGRSLLIKSRTKSETNSVPPPTNPPSAVNVNVNSNSILTVKANNISSVQTTQQQPPSLPVLTPAKPLPPPPPPPPPPVVTSSRPETPQSLSESEEDSCQLDLSSVLYNLDNLKPPHGHLWDDVLAAVEQEHANGIELPPLSASIGQDSSDSEHSDIVIKNECDDECCDIEIVESTLKSEIKSEDEYDSSIELNSSIDDLPPSPATTNSSPVKTSKNDVLRNSIASVTTVVSDHSYDKRAWIRLEDLGVQTPSDSEEEVDVVGSYIHKSRSSSSRSSSRSSDSGSPGLPTNPSPEDQEEIQEITTSKLLLASKAVSKRLRSKITRNKGILNTGKRRLSESEEYKTTKLSKKPRVHYRPLKSRFATDSESDSKEKRDMHNNMERMRRIDLRNSFEELKALVPSLANKERAPKVLILQDAAGYCTDLKIQSRQLAVQVAALRKEQERLRATVSGLRRSLAAYR